MRKLATIRAISAIKEHGNADSLELAIIDGWTVVVRKGEYAAGDVVVFLEIDSFVQTAIAPFLTKPGKAPKEYNGVYGERLRTSRLRGVVSQGLVLPLSVLPTDWLYTADFHGLHISDGKYFSANGNSSSAPSVYLTQGKAEGRCKQITFCTDRVWEVVEWAITETVE